MRQKLVLWLKKNICIYLTACVFMVFYFIDIWLDNKTIIPVYFFLWLLSVLTLVFCTIHTTIAYIEKADWWPEIHSKYKYACIMISYFIMSLIAPLWKTYVLCCRFDNSLMLTSRKVFVLVVAVFAIIIFITGELSSRDICELVSENERHKKDAERSNSMIEQIQQNNLLSQNEESLAKTRAKKMLYDRLIYSLSVRKYALKPDGKGALGLQGYIKTNEDWENFVTDYNFCTNNLLGRLQADNPKLTDADMLYIVLTKMGMSSHDISLLMDSAEQTVWNRRQRLKEHLSSPIEDLDEWLTSLD